MNIFKRMDIIEYMYSRDRLSSDFKVSIDGLKWIWRDNSGLLHRNGGFPSYVEFSEDNFRKLPAWDRPFDNRYIQLKCLYHIHGFQKDLRFIKVPNNEKIYNLLLYHHRELNSIGRTQGSLEGHLGHLNSSLRLLDRIIGRIGVLK